MKNSAFAMLLASALTAPCVHAASPAAGWDAAVRAFDDTYWAAYNRCDIQALIAMNADDLEFYHDLGGVMRGKAQFDTAMTKNICANPSRKVRREVELYPTGANDFAMNRDIKVRFTVDGAGKGQGLVVRERGAIVAEATIAQ